MESEEQKVRNINLLKTYLSQIREPFEALWEDAISFTGHYIRGMKATSQGGDKTGTAIYDSSAQLALELLGNGMHGYMLSPGWFRLQLPNKLEFPRWSVMRSYDTKRMDEIPEIAEWLTDSQDVLIADFQRSNFYQQSPNVFKEGACIGYAPVLAEDIVGEDKTTFVLPHPREIYIGRDYHGRVDTVIRDYEITLRDAKSKFGAQKMEAAAPGFSQKHNANPYEKIKVIHAIYPRTQFTEGSLRADNLAYASMWVYGTKLLLESGYKTFPYIVWDWQRNWDETYGRGPAIRAINDITTAQAIGKSNLLAGSRLADPPYAMRESLRGRDRLKAGGRTYLKLNEEPPIPMDTGLKGLPYAVDMQERMDMIINKHFHTDVFLMMNQIAMENKNITATQIVEMSGEKAAVISPITESAENGFLNPVIDIMFEYAVESGRIPQAPQILVDIATQQKLNIEVDYQGPLSLARKRFYKTQGIRGALSDVVMTMQIKPDVIDIADIDGITRDLLKDSISPKRIRDEKEVQAIRDARQQAQAAEAMLQVGQGMVDAVPKLSKPVEKGSPLSAMVGGE